MRKYHRLSLASCLCDSIHNFTRVPNRQFGRRTRVTKFAYWERRNEGETTMRGVVSKIFTIQDQETELHVVAYIRVYTRQNKHDSKSLRVKHTRHVEVSHYIICSYNTRIHSHVILPSRKSDKLVRTF